ncbi:MAG: glycosyltransferase [Rickettsiales bacterium]|jgi:glycosyltransferase involved in cell wall biosynthesis|nr:glycosyltransferase [Rickettsiales bacterium]
MPRVSVLMPVYNAEKYIVEAIDSILAQTFSDFEFIIINDGSTDKSVEIIKSYKDKRIRFINNKENIGIAAVLNQGLDLATGEYIARMDSDDISMSNRFAKQIEYMDKHSDVGVLGTLVRFFPGDSRKNDGRHKKNITYLDLLLIGWCVTHPTVMLRRSVFEKNALRYDPESVAEDYDLWTRAIRFTQIKNMQEILLKYRWHDANVSQLKRKELDESVKKTKQKMLDFLIADINLQDKILNLQKNDTHGRQVKKIKLFGITIIKIIKET